jgi:hypothetical protein
MTRRLIPLRPLRFRGACCAALLVALSASLARAEESAHESEAPIDLAALDALITDADRQHWAYLPVRRPDVPAVQDFAWVRNPIDAFILSGLEQHGWRPAAPAEPRALLRRIYLDLIGLPPTLEEQDAFLADPSPEAVDAVVNRLLARAQYAERWARHWLDLVRYADSNGYERDSLKPHAWRYRDWVIQSLIRDKPYDQFILEQLAGDELPGAPPEAVIAMGYYRIGPWDDEPADPAEDRFDQLDDILNTTSQAFLGLTLACARCHNHKFEALTQHDYYRMAAIFNTLERPRDGRSELDDLVGTPEQIAAQLEGNRRIDELKKQLADSEDAAIKEYLASNPDKFPDEVLAALSIKQIERSSQQNDLARQYEDKFKAAFAAWVPEEVLLKNAELQQQITDLTTQTPDLPRGYFMREGSPNPPATHLLIRGKAARPGPEVGPGVPTVLAAVQPAFPPPTEKTSQRRLTLARWIASADNPLTARVMVNRIWQHHFGEGLVRSPSDFGVMGQPPTHPELLDYLAHWFVHDACWSLKKLHRLITSSNTYRLSKQGPAEYAAIDPENRRLWRFPYTRLEVEAIRDSVLAVSGQLNPKVYGPCMFPELSREAREGHSDPATIWPEFDERDASRRTIYAFVKRSLLLPMLETLDFCDTARTTPQRLVTSVAPQALALYNGEFVNRQAGYLAERLVREVGDDPAAQIERAYRLALCRPPTEIEQSAMAEYLVQEAAQQVADATATGATLNEADARRRALIQMCRVVFNLNEFVYPD